MARWAGGICHLPGLGSGLGALTLAILGFRPMTLFGYTLGGVVVLLGVVLLLGFGAFGAVMGVFGPPLAVPTYTPTDT